MQKFVEKHFPLPCPVPCPVKKKTTANFQNRHLSCLDQKTFFIKRKGYYVLFLWQTFFVHWQLLPEKIKFLCFEKCRNFDIFPTLQIKEGIFWNFSCVDFWVRCGCTKPFSWNFSKKFWNFRILLIPPAFSYRMYSSRYSHLNFVKICQKWYNC